MVSVDFRAQCDDFMDELYFVDRMANEALSLCDGCFTQGGIAPKVDHETRALACACVQCLHSSAQTCTLVGRCTTPQAGRKAAEKSKGGQRESDFRNRECAAVSSRCTVRRKSFRTCQFFKWKNEVSVRVFSLLYEIYFQNVINAKLGGNFVNHIFLFQ